MVLRIWLIQNQVSRLVENSPGSTTSGRTMSNVIHILVESGAIYTTVVLILLCTYVTGSYASYLVSDCVSDNINRASHPGFINSIARPNYSEPPPMCIRLWADVQFEKGIVFNLILIKVARGTAVEPVPDNSTHTILQFRRQTTTNMEMGDFGTDTADIGSMNEDLSSTKWWARRLWRWTGGYAFDFIRGFSLKVTQLIKLILLSAFRCLLCT